MTSTKRAALYARVSTEEQAGEGKESLGAQIGDMRTYCDRRAYHPLEPYVDVQSGADLQKQRPAFQRMLGDITSGRVDVVVVWRPDRAFRDLKPMIALRDALDAANIEIEGVTMPLDRRTLGLMAWVAEMELDNIRERVRMGKRGMAKKGLYATGVPPYGYAYDSDTKQLVIDEAEAAVVRRMFSLYLDEGLSMRGIARRLNAEKVPCRNRFIRSRDGRHKGWLASHVSRIFQRTTYKGQWQYGRRQTGRDGRRRLNDPERVIEVKVPAIVSEAVWEMARQKAERNKHHGQGHESSLFYLLRGLLRCDECGQGFKAFGTPAGRVRRRGCRVYTVRTEYRAYGCRGMDQSPHLHQCRKPGLVRAELIEQPVWEAVARACQDPALLREAATARIAELQDAGEESSGLIAKRRRQMAQAAKERDGAVSLAAQDQITTEDLRIRLERLDADTTMWQEELDRLIQAADLRAQAEEVTRLLEEFCQDVGPTLEAMTNEERRELLLSLVDTVWLAGDGTIRIECVITFQVSATAGVEAQPVLGADPPDVLAQALDGPQEHEERRLL